MAVCVCVCAVGSQWLVSVCWRVSVSANGFAECQSMVVCGGVQVQCYICPSVTRTTVTTLKLGDWNPHGIVAKVIVDEIYYVCV